MIIYLFQEIKFKKQLKHYGVKSCFLIFKFFETKKENNIIYLEFFLKQLPKLDKFQFKGLKKSEIDNLREELNLSRGVAIGDQLKNKTKNYILNFFIEKGFYDVECNITESISDNINYTTLIIDVKKNKRIKNKRN